MQHSSTRVPILPATPSRTAPPPQTVPPAQMPRASSLAHWDAYVRAGDWALNHDTDPSQWVDDSSVAQFQPLSADIDLKQWHAVRERQRGEWEAARMPHGPPPAGFDEDADFEAAL